MYIRDIIIITLSSKEVGRILKYTYITNPLAIMCITSVTIEFTEHATHISIFDKLYV